MFLNSTKVWLIRIEEPDRRTRSKNIGGRVIFKVRSTQDSFGTITKADPLEVDPTAKNNNIII